MQRDLQRLEDVRDAAGDVIEFCRGLDLAGFETDKARRYAALHALTIIGEASNGFSPELIARHSQVPWRRIIAFRHRLVHGYESLDLALVWEVATRLVPELRSQILDVLSREFRDDAG